MDRTYRSIADAIEFEIASGRLHPGSRLPPQRDYAHRERVAPSTVSRAYAELIRRGLVVGETGRGTFVRAAAPPITPVMLEPSGLAVDLELNFPFPHGTSELLSSGLKRVLADATRGAFGVASVAGILSLRMATADLLECDGWQPDPDALLFASSGKAAIAAVLSILAKPGDRIGVEALTYPPIKGFAKRFGVELVPIPLDEQGALPSEAMALHQLKPLSGLYLQPALHNPFGCSMSEGRRQAWAEFLDETGLFAIEDGVYRFLMTGDRPLAAGARDRVVYIDSLSKRAAPGLSIGMLAVPEALRARIGFALRTGAWAAGGLAVAAAQEWIASGTIAALAIAKRADAAARQDIAREVLSDLGLRSDARAYHAWLPLPEPWRGEAFSAAAQRLGIAVTPGSAFAVVAGHSPAAVRLALGAPPIPTLKSALTSLRRLALSGPEIEAE